MPVSSELVEQMATELLGRQLGASDIQEISKRLTTLLKHARALSEEHLIESQPMDVFLPGHPAWQHERQGDPAWTSLPQTGGASGHDVTSVHEDKSNGVGIASMPSVLANEDLLSASAEEMAQRIRDKECSPLELTKASLHRIAALNPSLNSFITVMADRALAAAKLAEEMVLRGENLRPLHGVPLALKDMIATAGVRTTAGSAILQDWVPTENATVVNLLENAGAIILGKTHTHEWAFGATNNNEFFGASRNPWDLSRVPGGSSGGSASAVVTGMVPGALGSDTAGSVRIPAAACGAVGFKPTYGLVSKHGVLPLAWSMDTVGPITRTVGDAALLFKVMAGMDSRDHTTVPASLGDVVQAVRQGAENGLKGVRIGVVQDWFEVGVQAEVKKGCTAAVTALESLGAEVQSVILPSAEQMLLVQRFITFPEASSYHTHYLQEHSDQYSADVRCRLELGQFVLARDYLAAQRLRGELTQRIAKVMEQADVLLLPTLPMRAPQVGAETVDLNGTQGLVAEALIRLTAPFNLTGQPAISLPCGTPGGLPVGFQIVGRPFEDELVLRVAGAYEAEVGWESWKLPV